MLKKYEIEIARSNQKYWEALNRGEANKIAKLKAYGGKGIFCQKQYENVGVFSPNVRKAVISYYVFVDGEGYVRVKTAKIGRPAIHKNKHKKEEKDRDLFEKNEINYPDCFGLYLIGQTFFNPITDEKYYWLKVGKSNHLKRRRKDYSVDSAMTWDIDYYIDDDLKENDCHEKLREICLHRHADEWFSVSRENYLTICEEGFQWFKEA